MKLKTPHWSWRQRLAAGTAFLLAITCTMSAQSSPAPSKSKSTQSPSSLEHEFFDALRDGNAQKILSYIPQSGVNIGRQPQHATYAEVEQQFQSHRGLYCKLFDSACIDTTIDLGNSARLCSYRELLKHSDKVRTAASEVTRGGVPQAVLVAQVKDEQCPSQTLIDFIFNLDADGWRLFSIP